VKIHPQWVVTPGKQTKNKLKEYLEKDFSVRHVFMAQ
jgi:hypothetical protein